MFDMKRIEILVEEIKNRKVDDYGATYKDVPALKEIARIVDNNLEIEKETLEAAYDCYNFLANQYRSMGRFSISSEYGLKALKSALSLYKNYDVKVKEIGFTFNNTLKDRNHYIDDDCEDIKQLLLGSCLISDSEIEKKIDNIKNHRRTLKADPVEMSEAYLSVIDEVEERIEKNRKLHGMGSCYEVWELKTQYLLEKGIVWNSPAMMNPRVMFD